MSAIGRAARPGSTTSVRRLATAPRRVRARASDHRRQRTARCAFGEPQQTPAPRLRTFAEDLALARAPRDGVEVTVALRLHTQPERDAALRDHVETTHLFDEQTGRLYEPDVPPEVIGWGEDRHEDTAMSEVDETLGPRK